MTKTDDLITLYDNSEKHFGAKVMLSRLVVLKMMEAVGFFNFCKGGDLLQ